MKKKSAVIPFYRFEHYLYKKGLRRSAKIVYHLMQFIFGCTIPPEVEMGGVDVDIPHYHGIVLHHTTVIGSNTLIYQNVTVGGRNGEFGAVIGNNCTICAGTCILGHIIIGDNVNIGANAVVLHDIPSDSTAVGVPARIIRHNQPIE